MESDDCIYTCALGKVFAYRCSDGRRLIDAFGSPSSVFSAGRSELRAVMHNADVFVELLCDPALLDWACDEVSWAADNGVGLFPYYDRRYPRRLAECEDAPLLLYCKGGADLNTSRALSVVGTRKSSWYGRDSCRRIISRLGALEEKPLIVSGLALGIDGCAHKAALEAGLPTVAVLPGGIDEIYPRQHLELAERIAAEGALVTDFARRTAPAAFTFVRRNRIIAGMSDATLLVESYARGGGLITVSLAESYGREVFAVPGRLSDYSFEGCHDAIRKNTAQIVAGHDTVPVAMGWMQDGARSRKKAHPGGRDLSPLKKDIVRLISERASLSADEVSVLLGQDIRDVLSSLSELEVEGVAFSEFGGKYVLSGSS